MAETDNMNLALPGSNEYVDVEVLNENFRKIDSAVLLSLAAAAPYSSEQTYAKGAYCTRSGRLYRCTTAITAAEVWTDGHWTETTVGTELVSIYVALAEKAGKTHASQHASGGSDPVQISMSQVTDLNTTLANKANTADLQSHTANKSNPHVVTAAQTGAYTKAETDTRLNARIDKSFGVNMIQDLSSTDDFGNKSCIFRVLGDAFGIFPGTYAPYARLRSSPNGSYDMWFGITSGNWLHYCKTSDGGTPTSTSWVRVPKIAIGSYVGTGTFSSANPNSLTFDFEPKVVIIVLDGNSLFPGTVFIRGQGHSETIGQPYMCNANLTVTWSGNTVSWYTTNASYKENAQLNISGSTYRYIALG